MKKTLDIRCIRRTGKSMKKTIGKDILDLFHYIVGYVDIFPKHLITKDSKLANAVLNGDTVETQSMRISDKMKLVELQNVVKELQEKTNDVIKENKRMKDRIDSLENMVENMKIQTAVVIPSADTSSTEETARVGIISGMEKESTSEERHENTDKQPCKETTEQEVNNTVGDSSEDDVEIPCGQGSPKCQNESVHYNIPHENGIDWTTVIRKKKRRNKMKSSSSSEEDQPGSPHSEVPDASRLFVRLPESPTTQQTHRQRAKATYGQMVKKYTHCSKW